jgi:arylsulfatase A-like enzyme
MIKKIFLLSCFCAIFSSCSPDPEVVIFDFFQEFPQARMMAAERHAELFRTWTTEARMFGWTRDQKIDKTALIVPIKRARAVFRFGSVSMEDQRFTLKLRSLLSPTTGPAPVLNIHLNGHRVHASSLDGSGFRELSFTVSKEHMQIGENYLEFQCSPLPDKTGDTHWLALQSVRFGGPGRIFYPADDSEPQLVKIVGKKGLVLSANTILDFVLKVPPRAVLDFDLAFDTARSENTYGEKFVIALTTTSGESSVLFEQGLGPGIGRDMGTAPIDLSSLADQVCRISFAFLSNVPRERSPAAVSILNAGIRGRAGRSRPDRDTSPGRPFPQPFNILIYLVDCLRPDHLPFHGYPRNTAPHMAEFVKDSVLFSQAYAQSSWTRPSVGVLFTGLYPFQHLAIDLKSGLAREHRTLAEILQDAGFHTLGISSNAGIKQFFNFDQGFSYFKYHSNLEGGTADRLNTYAFAELQKKQTPFFLYVHTMEPHRPYQLKEEFAPVFTEDELAENSRVVEVENLGRINLYRLIAMYDATIAQNDKSFGDLMAELKRLGLYDETLIVLMSDHGEQFYEHGGFAHGQNLYQETVKHLFAVKLPGQMNAGAVIPEIVQEIDILPTLLDLAGIPVPSYCPGSSLGRLLLSPPSSGPPLHSEIFLETGVDLNHKAIITGRWKIIHVGKNWSDDLREYELFDLEEDPGEQVNLIGRNPVAAEYLKKRLSGWALAQKKLVDIGKEGVEKTLTEKEIRELKALGYIK